MRLFAWTSLIPTCGAFTGEGFQCFTLIFISLLFLSYTAFCCFFSISLQRMENTLIVWSHRYFFSFFKPFFQSSTYKHELKRLFASLHWIAAHEEIYALSVTKSCAVSQYEIMVNYATRDTRTCLMSTVALHIPQSLFTYSQSCERGSNPPIFSLFTDYHCTSIALFTLLPLWDQCLLIEMGPSLQQSAAGLIAVFQ